jgi:hypothetical protein
MALKITTSIPYKKGNETGNSNETYLVIEEFYCNKSGQVQLPVRCFKSKADRDETKQLGDQIVNVGWDKNKVENFIDKKFVFQLTAEEMAGGLQTVSYSKIKAKLEELYTVEIV